MEELRLSHLLERDAVAFGAEHQLHLLASLTAPEGPDETEETKRSPVDLVAVLDRSGSMSGAKLQAVKDTTKFLVQQLSAQDKLSVVSFENDVDVNFALREMTEENKAAAELAIDRIKAGGGTNLSGGLFKGIDQHQQMPETPQETGAQERVRTVFLFTDGQATTGVTNNARLKSILSMMLQASIRPTIHCFGFGSHYDAACLEAIVEAGQGQSYFIEDSESTPAAFASALGGLMSMVAQNVEVTFKPKAGVTIKDVDTTFRKTSNNGIFTVTLGDLFAEEKKDLLATLQVEALDDTRDSQDLVTVHLRYLHLAMGHMCNSEASVTVARPATAPADTAVHGQVQEAMLRISTAKAMKDAVALGDRGNLPGARSLLQRQLDLLPSESPSAVITALREDLRLLLRSYEDRTSYFQSRHVGLSMAHGHSSQRHTSHTSAPFQAPAGLAAGFASASANPYSTRSQTHYSRRATESVRAAMPSAPAGTQPAASLTAPQQSVPNMIGRQAFRPRQGLGPSLGVDADADGQGNQSSSAAEARAAQRASLAQLLAGSQPGASATLGSSGAQPEGAEPPLWQELLGVQGGNNQLGGRTAAIASRRRTSDRSRNLLDRTPSNVSAAGTEVYDPVASLAELADQDLSGHSHAPAGPADSQPPDASLTFPSAVDPPTDTPRI